LLLWISPRLGSGVDANESVDPPLEVRGLFPTSLLVAKTDPIPGSYPVRYQVRSPDPPVDALAPTLVP